MTGDESEPTGKVPEGDEEVAETSETDSPETSEVDEASAENEATEPEAGAEPTADADSASDSASDSQSDSQHQAEDDDDDVSAVLLPEVDLPPPASVPVPTAAPPVTVFPSAEVIDISPTEGPVMGGTKITITGRHLHRASIVRVGAVLAAIVAADEPRELKVVVPEHKKPGSVELSIQNPGAELTVVADAFRYLALPTPKISTVAPNHAAVKGGTELAITGEGFVKGCKVLLDGTEVDKVVFVDGKNLEVTVPPGDNGKMVDVVVESPDGKTASAPRAFVYDERYG